MQYHLLGNTTLNVSKVAFGCWAIVGGFNWGKQDERDSLAALTTAFDQGINFFDTAEAYGDGRSEVLIAKALKSRRKELVIASKALPKNFAPAALKQACESSLQRLQTDYIDLYQLHWPGEEELWDETLATLVQLQKEGKIRYYGVSNFGVKDMGRCIDAGYVPSTNQLAYNLLFRAIEYEILPLCQQREIPVLCYSPLMQGLLAGKFLQATDVPEDRARTRHFASSWPQARHSEDGVEDGTFQTIRQIKAYAQEIDIPMADLSLSWLLHQEGIGAIIVGGRNAQQVMRNATVSEVNLDNVILQRLREITEPLKEQLGENADLWQDESRIR